MLGNINIMNSCHDHKIKRFIYASTVYVHSREGGFYRCSKEASESFIQEFYKTYGLKYTILRYGSLYGPRANASNGMYKIISKAIKLKTSISWTPETMRQYIHVEDAAKASVVALDDDFINQSNLDRARAYEGF